MTISLLMKGKFNDAKAQFEFVTEAHRGIQSSPVSFLTIYFIYLFFFILDLLFHFRCYFQAKEEFLRGLSRSDTECIGFDTVSTAG